jgi:hypothetical protein
MPDLTSADQTFPSNSPAQSAVSALTDDTHPDEGDAGEMSGEAENPYIDDNSDCVRPDSLNDAPDRAPFTIPGPGVPEALFWMFGMLVVHMIGGVITMAVLVVNHLRTLPTPPANARRLLMEAQQVLKDESQMLNLITGEMAFFLVVAVIASIVRLGRSSGRRLGLTRIPVAHLALITTVSIPLSLMCGAFHHVTTEVWDSTLGNLPIFELFQGMDVNQTLKPLGQSAPLWLLIGVIAVAPAIGEEVIFRGVIGRGLIARHGVMAGVVMTSLMFAAVHIHPAHVIALLPLAFFIHLVYLVTRSFWAPVLLHLLNNSLAVVLLRFGDSLEGSGLDEEAAMPLPLIAISAAVVIMSTAALWKSRVQYLRSDGSIWDPGYPTVELPPADSSAISVHTERPSMLFGLTLMLASVYSVIFVATLVMSFSPAG